MLDLELFQGPYDEALTTCAGVFTRDLIPDTALCTANSSLLRNDQTTAEARLHGIISSPVLGTSAAPVSSRQSYLMLRLVLNWSGLERPGDKLGVLVALGKNEFLYTI